MQRGCVDQNAIIDMRRITPVGDQLQTFGKLPQIVDQPEQLIPFPASLLVGIRFLLQILRLPDGHCQSRFDDIPTDLE